METTLQRIIRKTGRKPTACKCAICKEQCRTPCLGTPEDILRLIKAGYGNRLKLTQWCVGMLVGKIPYPITMIQAQLEDNGYCTFFHDGLCELHDLGLKPTEGKLSSHILSKDNFQFSKSLSWNVAKEWLSEKNITTIEEIFTLMKEIS